MNYTKRGIKEKQRSLHATGAKIVRKILLYGIYLVVLAFIACGTLGISLGLGIFKGVIDTSPSIESVSVTPTGYSTFVYDIKGNQTAKLVSQNSNRIPVTYDMVPENLAHAFVAIEDERFYEHNGIDIKGIIRAAYVGVSNKFHFSEGASTITQQLLKNNVFTDWTEEDSFAGRMKRKIQEQYLAIELTKKMSKEDVLINYMNTINLGQNTLGVQAASLRYFNKSVSTLSLSECAVIAGITQNPSKFNPISHPENNAERRKKVLKNMLDQGYISEAEFAEAMADDVYSRIQIINSETETDTVNSYFIDALTDDVMTDLLAAGYNESQAFTLLYSGGLKIYSTQDPDIQAICDDVFSNEENYPSNVKWALSYALTVVNSDGSYTNYSSEKMRTYFKENVNSKYTLLFDSQEQAYEDIETFKAAVIEAGSEVYDESVTLTPQPQVSITIEDQSTGHIVAMVGGRGPKEGSKTLNRATDTMRQPGSTFKIVAVYAPALDAAGLSLATAVNDAPFNYMNGRPVSNWWGASYRGISSIRTGIKDSMNVVAVRTLTYITPQLGFDYLKAFGFTTIVDREEINTPSGTMVFSDIQQSTGLGGLTHGVTNEELNAAYACIANHGLYIKPKLYTKVVDHDGNVILDNTEPETRQVLKETTAWLLTSAMETVVNGGTGSSVNFGGMAIAGKTGTTSDYNDVWFAGYTPYYTASVWTGYDDNTKLKSNDEKNLSKKLWRAVMSRVHADLEYEGFPRPSGIISATVCAKSGKLPVPGLCDSCLVTEYFAEGTVPTESCDVHYQGAVCQYCNLPASEMCPFKVEGVLELTPADNILLSGDANAANNAVAGSAGAEDVEVVQTICPHNWEFFTNPDAQAIIDQQRAEIWAANEAAAQAAAQAAADAAAQAAAQAAEAAANEG